MNTEYEYIAFQSIQNMITAARVQSGRVEKWQLTSEDHSRILRMLSETLDVEV